MKSKYVLPIGFICILCAFASVVRAQPGTQLWSYEVPGSISSAAALAPDGTIYIGSAFGLCAITNQGSNKWTFTSAGSINGTPAIGSDGTVYFCGNADSGLYAVNGDGSLKWSRSINMGGSSPLIGPGNSVGAAGSEYFYSFASDGSTNWLSALSGSSASTPVMAQDGSISVGADKFVSFNSDGSLKWAIRFGVIGGDTISLGKDGTIYACSGYLYAISSAGVQLWQNHANMFSGHSAPAVGADGTIYAASDGNHSLYAISPSGQTLWNAGYEPAGPGYPTTTPAIDSGGMIYYAASNSIFAISPQGSIQWIFSSKYALLPPPPPLIPTSVSPAIGPDGTIYAAFGSTLYAIQGSGNPLATSPWPMYRQNLRHTGKVEKPTLAPPKKRADANVDLQLAGEIGQAYSVQSTSNFLNWTSITSFVASTLPMSISDLTATNAPTRFYRATTP